MAAQTLTFAFEQRFAARGITAYGRVLGGDGQRPQIRHDLTGLDIGKRARRHRRALYASPDDIAEVIVRRGAPELTMSQVHTGDCVALSPVTAGAISEKQLFAVFDVARSIGTLLGDCGPARQDACSRQDECEKPHKS
jgi:hypothetical protein